MNSFEEIKILMKEKSGKKLVTFSGVVFLLITLIVFFSAFVFCRDNQLKLMDESLGAIPKLVESLENELKMRSRVYEEDAQARAELGLKLYGAELGLKLYGEENGLTDAERLERVRSEISADSVSLLDEQGQMLSTTGPVCPEEYFRACIRNLKPRSPHFEIYPALSEDGEETGKSDGKGFLLLPIPGNTKRSLVFEFSCDTVMELYNVFDDWAGVFEQTLVGEGTSAFAKTGDKLEGYPLDGLTPEETSRLYEELTKVFQNSDRFRNSGNGSSGRIITLLGKRYLAEMMQGPLGDTDILLTVPFKNVVRTGFYIAAAISAIIGWGIILFQIYVFRRLLRKKAEGDMDAASRKQVCRTTRPGILVVLAVTVIFSSMLLLLESRANVSVIAEAKRSSVQREIDWHKDQADTIRGAFEELYRARAQMLADFLKENPDYQTAAGLEELSRLAKTDYLMRFDSGGQELISSNSYTGFSVGTNLSDEYRAVLLGYPYAVVGPTADPFTGRMQLGAASLMKDGEGRPDGFLLAAYNAEDLNAELDRMSYENTVNGFAVQKDHIVAAIDGDGLFIAHTDPEMIGRMAADVLEDVKPGSDFAGFTEYKGEDVYVSASTADGKTLLYIMPERWSFHMNGSSVLLILAVLLLPALLYFPNAAVLGARAIEEAEGKLGSPAPGTGNPLMIFSDGYFVFLTLFAIVAWIASASGLWPAFDYVFNGRWSKGVNLFSLWAALFVLAVTLCVELLIRTALNRVESRLSLKSKTITRLAKSLVAYAVGIFLAFCILDMFGANTTALLASAGIISIAVGMGTQSFASDLLSGFFMMMEGNVHVGDHVSVAGITGHITDIGIRSTEITDEEGNVMILNNSQVSGVLNMSRKHERQELEDAPENEL